MRRGDAAAHRVAWDSASSAAEAWVHQFLTEAQLDRKLKVAAQACNAVPG